MNIWRRLGVSVLILTIFGIVISEIFKKNANIQSHKIPLSYILSGAGLLLWLIGNVHRGNDAEGEEAGKNAPRKSLFTLRYIGTMVMLFGALTRASTKISEAFASSAFQMKIAAAERLIEKIPKGKAPAEPESAAQDFPSLKVQGASFGTTNPSVIVSGKTIFVGDKIERAKVVSIERQSITLEAGGQTKVFYLRY